MTRKSSLLLVTVVGVILLIVLESVAGKLQAFTRLSDETLVRIEVGSALLLVLLVVNLVFHFSSIQADEVIDRISSIGVAVAAHANALDGKIAVLNHEDLYELLTVSAAAAKSRVCNCYFGQRPPSASLSKSKKKYFAKVVQLAKQNKQVEFRRIVLLTAANLPWIQELAESYRGHTNSSLAIYRHSPAAASPLSVQVFDESRVFVIHAAERPSDQPRDFAIDAREVVVLLDDYYENVWNCSTVVVDSGNVLAELSRLSAAL